MQTTKFYIAGLPWEVDRIGLANFVNTVLEAAGMEVNFALPYMTQRVERNHFFTVVDVFVARDRETDKSRGFGFITVETPETNDAEGIMRLLNGKKMLSIRGIHTIIVSEAHERSDNNKYGRSRVEDSNIF